MLPPISIADQNGTASSLFCIVSAEIPSQQRLNTENLEKIGRDPGNRRARRLRTSRNRRNALIVFRNGLEAATLIAKVVEVRIRNSRRPALRGDLKNSHYPVRVGIRQWTQQHPVNHTENRRRRANTQC